MGTIKICKNHQEEQKTPLIWTFAFNGSEYWCPYCGFQGGMLGSGDNVVRTKELEDRLETSQTKSKDFLRATSTAACDSLLYEGKRITPEELPDQIKEQNKRIIDRWVYESSQIYKQRGNYD